MIASRLKKVTPSLTLEITALAKKMKSQGERVVNFAAGEPDFDTPEYIKKAAIFAIREGFTKYTPSTGILRLKEAISKKLKQDNSLHYSPSQIIVTSGAKHALYNILQAICEKGDQVLLASPYWVSYLQMVNLAQAKPQIVRASFENNFKLDKRLLEKKINRKTKAIILNSPGNPAGCVYSRSELAEIAEIVIKKNLYIISDEIYEKLVFDNKKHISIASLNKEIFRRTILVNGVSKAYAMTGWRIGYLACPSDKIIKAITSLQSHSTSNPCSISQKAALEAINRTERSQMRKMVKEFQLRRDYLFGGLESIERIHSLKPEGTFYIFCNISGLGLDSLSFARRLLKEAKVAVVAGKAFGRDDYIRLSFATSREQIQEGIHRLRNWVERQ